MTHPSTAALGAWIVPAPEGRAHAVFGLDGTERARRGLVRAGVAPERIAVAPAPLPAADAIVLLRGDCVYDPRVLEALVAHPDTAVVAPEDGGPGAGGAPELFAAHVGADRAAALQRALAEAPHSAALPGLRVQRPEALAPAYDPALRKAQPARVWTLRSRADVPRVERQLFRAAYKGVTDLVTAWVWPLPALALTRVLARRGVSPNAVTAASWLLVLAATALFAVGLYGPGLVAAWLMTFLDTVDGKLARVTLRASRVGHVLDHGLDLLHPPFWYLAFGLSLAGASGAGDLGDWRVLATWVCVVGYVLGRAEEGVALLVLGFEIHSWRPLDSAFRRVTARRNPNLLLLTAGTAAGRPDLGLAAVAAWTVACLVFHATRLGQALAARRRGEAGPWQGRSGAARPAAAASSGFAGRTQEAR